MQWKIILILLLLLLAVIFTAQNYEVVTIQFLFWAFKSGRAIIFFLTLTAGIIIGWTMSFITRR